MASSGNMFIPAGYNLYLEGSEDTPAAEVIPRVGALIAFLKKQQYNLDRVSAKGSFTVDYAALLADAAVQQRWPGLDASVRGEPETVFSLLGMAMYQLLHEDASAACDGLGALTRVPKVAARIQGFGPLTKVRNIKSANYGRLVAVKGTVVRVSNVNPYCLSMSFECSSCFDVRHHPLPGGNYQVPSRCDKCNGTQFRPLKSFKTTRTVDRQTFRLQEFSEEDATDTGRVPRTIECELLADLVDACVPGDIVTVCGVVKTFDDPSVKTKASSKNMHLLYVAVNSIANVKAGGKSTSGIYFTRKDYYAITEVHDRPDTFRLLVQSLCPGIYGHDMVKAGLLLGLFGGTSRPAGVGQELHVRGDPHVLLMGDPGLGKSQLLQACAAVAPRGVYVCGNTSTTSGLTVTLTREKHNEYLLEAGALVLADQGCCCIDEFDKMTAQYQPLLEAMEQQSVSIAKGGIVATLPSRTSVLAAANPSGGHFNRDKSLEENLKMGAALLSRFDLVFVLLDRPDGTLDSLVSSHIMALHASASGRASSLDSSVVSEASWDPSLPLAERLAATETGPTVPHALLRKYVAYARKYVHPRLAPAACRALQEFFLELRARQAGADSVPVTTRQLESLIRLTQARARLDLREDATAADAEDVIQLVRFAMSGGGRDDEEGGLPAARGRGKKRGKSGRLKQFLKALQRSASRLGKAVFTEEELRDVAAQAGAAHEDFREFLEMANQAGVLLKRGPKLYQVQDD